MDSNFPYLGGSFDSIYFVQNTKNRFKIKSALKHPVDMIIQPDKCIRTEQNQDEDKILTMIPDALKLPPVHLFLWGCDLLIINGHHRIMSLVLAGITNVNAKVSKYQC